MLTRIMICWVIGLLIVLPGDLTAAQETDDLLAVRFMSFPAGASIYLDGALLGTTLLETQLEPGEYAVKFSLPGFVDWEDEFVVYAPTTISATLQSDGELTRLMHSMSWLEWDPYTNRIRLKPFIGKGSDLAFVTYDLASDTIDSNTPPIHWLQDANLRQALEIASPDQNTIFAVAYESPSGRYIGYVPQHETPILTIYDRTCDVTLSTDVHLPSYSDLAHPEYSLRWSPNEHYIYVKRATVTADCSFIALETTRTSSTCITATHDNSSNMQMWVDRFFGSPNNNGQILAAVYNENNHGQLWVINLADLSGTFLGFENVFDAVFASDDANIVYVASREGLVRYDLASGEQMLIESLLSELPVLEISLAPTLDYALIQIGEGENTSYWMYRLPLGLKNWREDYP